MVVVKTIGPEEKQYYKDLLKMKRRKEYKHWKKTIDSEIERLREIFKKREDN